MKKYLRILIIVSVCCLCLAGYLMQIFNSLPWMDEVCYSDITQSLALNNTFTLNLLLTPKEALTWGPVYFYTQEIFLSIFGFGMVQFRLLNLLSGIFILLAILYVAKTLNISKLNIFILLALIGFDSRFTFNIISGRMDLYALALFMGSWLLFQNINKRTYFRLIIAGIISCISFLTTPRIGFYFLIYFLTFLVELLKSKNRRETFIQYFVFCISILIPVFIWIFLTYGGIIPYINSYLNSPFVAEHYGGSFFPVKYQIPILVLWFLGAIYVFKSKQNLKEPTLVALFFLPVCHLLFIKEVGPYSAMLMPFIYLGIMISINSMSKKEVSIIPGIMALYLFLGSFSSSFNNLASLEFTNPDSFRTFFKSQQVTQRNVLADNQYYYYVVENGNRFISLIDNKKELSVINLNNSNIEYAIISKNNYKKNEQLFEGLGFSVISEFQSKKGESCFYRTAIYFNKTIRNGYDGFLLKREI